MLQLVAVSVPAPGDWKEDEGDVNRESGGGTIDGLSRRRNSVPKVPIVEEKMRPERVPSTRYQRTGLIKVNAMETWRVDVHGSLR